MKESFNDLYTRLYMENIEELESLRKKEKDQKIKILFLIAIAFVLANVSAYFLIPFYILIVIALIKSHKNKKIPTNGKSYKEVFCQNIVKPIIENTFEKAKYEPSLGISEHDYVKAEYNDDIDRYHSEDLVEAYFNVENENIKIIFSEVHTQKESKDNEGHRTYVTEFKGIASSFKLSKSIGTKIFIRGNWQIAPWNKNKVKMDMTEFEKNFDVESEDAILTMRVLTSDVMTKMLDLYEKYKCRFEINIINDTVYMRLHTGTIFEPDTLKNAMDYKTIESYYLKLKALIEIATHVYDNIQKLEI